MYSHMFALFLIVVEAFLTDAKCNAVSLPYIMKISFLQRIVRLNYLLFSDNIQIQHQMFLHCWRKPSDLQND